MRPVPPLALTPLEPREVPDATPVLPQVVVAPADTVRETRDAGGKIDHAQVLKVQPDRPVEVSGQLIMQPGAKPKERRADIDMYKFDVRAGQVIGFDVVRGQGTPDLLVRVIGPGVDIRHGFAERPASRSPLLLHRFEQAGVYTLIVTALRNDHYNFRTGDTLVLKQGQRADGLTGRYAVQMATTDVKAVSAEVVPGSGLRVNYRLGGYGLNDNLWVGVYRSASPVFDRASAELVQPQFTTSAYADDGKPGDHQFNVALFPNEGATAARPYLFVALDDPPIPYVTVGAGAGRFREPNETDNVVLVGGLADVRTSAAFTEDGSGVTVRYAVENAALLAPVRFGLYRSASPTFERAGAELIGTAAPGTDSAGRPAQELGEHEVTVSFGQPPRGTAEKPYLFVLADGPADPADPSPVGAVMEPREDNNAQPLGRITLAQLSAVMGRDRRGQPDATLDRYLDAVNRTFGEFGIVTYKRQAGFLGQVRWETKGVVAADGAGGLRRLEEYLNYTPERMLAVFGAFKRGELANATRAERLEKAKTFAGRPEALANFVYAGMNGNRDEASGDGWKYRGRGFKQITGESNYKEVSQVLYGDETTLLDNPDSVATDPLVAARTAGAFWHLRGMNAVADVYSENPKSDDETLAAVSLKLSKIVNQYDTNSFPGRQQYFATALRILRPATAVARDLPLDPPPPLLPAAVSGFVYADANRNGTKDASEAGIPGTAVVLHGANVARTATTDTNGFYRFGGLVGPGPYSLTGLQPVGYLDGTDTPGTLGGVAANDTITGITFVAGRESVNNNFGEVPLAPRLAPPPAAPATAIAADERMVPKGIQAVLLSRWSAESVGNLIAVLKEQPADAPPVEIAFAANYGDAGSRYSNIRRVIDELVAAGRGVRVTVHLGFHTRGNVATDSGLKKHLDGLAEGLNSFLTTADPPGGGGRPAPLDTPGVSFVVSPSLEDNFRTYDDFAAAARLVASKFTADTLGRLTFRRSSVHGEEDNKDRPVAADVPGRKELKRVRSSDGTADLTLPLEHEYHGLADDAKGYGVFSNDGVFVRSAGDLDGNGVKDESKKTANADGSGTTKKPSLDEWLDGKPKSVRTSLLWRPSYNLFAETAGGGFDVDGYARPKFKSGSQKGKEIPPGQRNETAETGLAFDHLEQQVLRKFLGLPLVKKDTLPRDLAAPPAVPPPAPAPVPPTPVPVSPPPTPVSPPPVSVSPPPAAAPTPPATPANLRAANVWARATDLNWDDRSGGETEFRVAVSRDGGRTWENVGVAGANATGLRVSGLLPNTRYLFKVRAANAGGYSDYSNTVTLTTRRA